MREREGDSFVLLDHMEHHVLERRGGVGSRNIAEFILGAIAGTSLGVVVAADADGAGLLVFGVWMAGVCLNYVPQSIHSLSLASHGRLDAELDDVDIPQELRRYARTQLWIAVPLLFVVLASLQAYTR